MASVRADASAPSKRATGRLYYGHWMIVAAFVTQFVSVGAQNYAIGSFMLPMIDELGWTRAEFVLPRSLAQFVTAFTGFVIGAQVDRRGARPLMLFGMVVLALSLWGLSHASAWWQWVLLNGVVLTVGASLLGNLVVSVTLAKWFVEKRGQAIAWAAMGISFGGIGVTPLITAHIDRFGWRSGWQAMAVATVLLTLPAALVMRRTPEDHGLHPDGKTAEQVANGEARRAQADYDGSLTRAQALRSRAFYMLVLAFGLYQVNIPVILIQTVPFISDAGYSRGWAAWLILIASIPAMATKPVWGWLIDRMNPKPLAALSATLTGLAMMMIVITVQQRSTTWQSVAFFLMGIGWGGMIPMQEVIWASHFGRRHLGAIRGAALPMALVIGAVGPLAVAYYHDVVGNYDGALLFVGGMAIVGAVVILALPKSRIGR
ncbi:MAG: MFS transporter [Burkholderiaceae bacterium]